MTDKELKHLSRAELLEMLITATKENDELHSQVSELEAKLADRKIKIDKAGSLAEASLQLNNVFEAAQAAAAQYLDNIRTSEDFCRNMKEQAEMQSVRLLEEAKLRAAEIERNAQEKADIYWKEVSVKLEKFYAEHQALQQLLDYTKGAKG